MLAIRLVLTKSCYAFAAACTAIVSSGAAAAAVSTAQYDPTFGASGTVHLVSLQHGPISLAVLADDRVRAAGTRVEGLGQALVLAGLTATGVPDTTFGSGGVATISLDLADSEYAAVSHFIQCQDGGFLAVVTVRPQPYAGAIRLLVAKTAADGRRDEHFATHGVQSLLLSQAVYSVAIAHRPAGGWILLERPDGEFPDQGYVLQALREDGGVDTAFGNQGSVAVHSDIVWPIGIAAFTSGAFQVLGDNAGLGRWHRFLSNGSDDLAFGPHGERDVEYPGVNQPRVAFLEPANGGGYLIAVEGRVRRLRDDGQWDLGFDAHNTMFADYVGGAGFADFLRASPGFVAFGASADGSFGPAITIASVYGINDGSDMETSGLLHGVYSTDIAVDSHGRLLFAGVDGTVGRLRRPAAASAATVAVPALGAVPALFMIVALAVVGRRQQRRLAR